MLHRILCRAVGRIAFGDVSRDPASISHMWDGSGSEIFIGGWLISDTYPSLSKGCLNVNMIGNVT